MKAPYKLSTMGRFTSLVNDAEYCDSKHSLQQPALPIVVDLFRCSSLCAGKPIT